MEDARFLPYDENFPRLFAEEKSRLVDILGENILAEHVGSTSVEGLKGKGIVDIYVLVNEGLFEDSRVKLMANGYNHIGTKVKEDGIRAMFERNYLEKEKRRWFHVHLGEKGSKNFAKCITFRDRLRKDPFLREQYETLKIQAVRESEGDRETYRLLKEKFISKNSSND